jgi:glycosyltransferase involved in cell wall biosynthesis
MITICFTYFRSLTLRNFEAALYSVRRQDLSLVEELVIVDNNTDDRIEHILAAIEELAFPIPVFLMPCKHGDESKTHSWSTNAAVGKANTPWVFFTRADYLLEFDLLRRCVDEINKRDADWNGFVTANGCHLDFTIDDAENTMWRERGPNIFDGVPYDYTVIDTGVWLARKDAFDAVGGLDEGLNAWGHSQTHFQWKLHKSGVEFVRIPEVLFYHPGHGGHRDIVIANHQLASQGLSPRDLWERYEGPRVY